MSTVTPVAIRPKPVSKAPALGLTSAEVRPFRSALGAHVLVVDGSRIYDLSPEAAGEVDALASLDSPEADRLWSALGLVDPGPDAFRAPRSIDGTPLDPPPLASISLNVMAACNMSCGYCYADEGTFGGPVRAMSLEVAKASVDRLIAESQPGADLVLGYMGGEPLLNRRVVHEATRYAAAAAARAERRIRFSLTTNLTTLRSDDAALFRQFPFTVAVSIDGDRDQNDALRRMRDGSSAYDRLLGGLELFERYGRPRHLAARVTVTPCTTELLATLDHLVGLGFDEVGFAAVLVSPDPALAFAPTDFSRFTEAMIACGEKALGELRAGRRYPFGNLETALAQLHRGTHRPYPCGAGAAYLSASAQGQLFACHRLIDDPAYAMGSVSEGSDREARSAHLARSHVDLAEPCRSCWARYLCGGGCYHEVSRRGRIACDYIRGWLDFCLRAYAELSAARPEYFSPSRHSPPWCPLPVSSPTTVS